MKHKLISFLAIWARKKYITRKWWQVRKNSAQTFSVFSFSKVINYLLIDWIRIVLVFSLTVFENYLKCRIWSLGIFPFVLLKLIKILYPLKSIAFAFSTSPNYIFKIFVHKIQQCNFPSTWCHCIHEWNYILLWLQKRNFCQDVTLCS